MTQIQLRLLLTFLIMSVGGLLPQLFVYLSNKQIGMLVELPNLLFILIIIFSQFFKQGRSGFISLVMLIAYNFIQTRLQVPLSIGCVRFDYYFLALAVPITLLTLSILAERSVLSVAGLWYVAFIGWLVVLFYWFESSENSALLAQLITAAQPWLFVLSDISPLPVLLIGLLVCAMLLAAIQMAFHNRASDQAVLSALIAFSWTIVGFEQQWISVSMFIMSALFLLFSQLRRSHEQAFIDELTQIPGRSALNSDMHQLHGQFTIAMLDIDHFKKFNDTYGHDIGDNVLKMVAMQLTKVQGRGKVYRYGGEEFTVLFRGKKAADCIEHLEQVRELIAAYPFCVRDNKARAEGQDLKQLHVDNAEQEVQVTVSIGVAEGAGATSIKAVIKVADSLLYEAKEQGRNRVCA